MKVCSNPECTHHGELQPLENFYKHRKHKDGYCSSCKDCAKAHRKTEAGKATYTRWNNSEKGKQAMRKFERSKYGRTRRMKYREEHADSYKEWQYEYNRSEAGKETTHRYEIRHPEAYEGRKAIMRLIDRGIIPPARETTYHDCGKPARDYHHHLGYSPEHLDDVIPLCFNCHKRRHRKLPML